MPQHQCSSNATTIGNATGCDHWNRAHGIDHTRHQCHGCNLAAHMPTRFPALGDDDIDACLNRVGRLFHAADCVHHQAIVFVDDLCVA